MNSEYTILFRKGSDGNVVNSFTQWGIVCCKVPFKAGGKTKDVAVRDWHDEHGEDAYIPTSLYYEAYDAEFEFAYQGEELATSVMNLSLALTQIENFKHWLSGVSNSGASLCIYSPFSRIGRQGCYVKNISDESPCVMVKGRGTNIYHENVVTFKVTFRVTDPRTSVTLA